MVELDTSQWRICTGEAKERWVGREPLITFFWADHPVLLISLRLSGWLYLMFVNIGHPGDHRHHVYQEVVMMVTIVMVMVATMSMLMMIGDDTGGHRGQWVGVRAWEARGSGRRVASSRARQPPTWALSCTWVHLGQLRLHLGPDGFAPRFLWLTW